MSTVNPVLELYDVSCVGENARIDHVQLAFIGGTVSVIRGTPSSGKAPLLRVLGLFDPPLRGEVLLAGDPVQELDTDARAAVRDQQLGFVFHAPFLLGAMTVVENVAMPLFRHSLVDAAEARRRTDTLLELVGLADLGHRSPGDLTVLDQYRAALARALINQPVALLVEDLDATFAGTELQAFTALLREVARRLGVAVLATASPDFIPEPGDRVIDLAAGAPLRDSSCPARALP